MNAQPGRSNLQVDPELVKRFEQSLDPRHPEKCVFLTRVLGYGEISTVLDIDLGTDANRAYKRMPMFKTVQEAEKYATIYREYLQVLEGQVNLHTVQGDLLWVTGAVKDRVVAYIVQEKLPTASIGSQLIRHLPAGEVQKLVLAVLRETAKVFDFNQVHKGSLELGIDGQISNWAVVNVDPNVSHLREDIQLTYFDTSTPFLTKAGKEQLDPELFLRSAPSFLVWILRLLFLKDVMTRYYDFRKVCVDIIANFHKEQRSDLIPSLVDTVNAYLSKRDAPMGFEPITVKEINDYYREDALIWRLYLTFRKFDRSLHRFLGKPYPYILPDKVKR
jgi:Family of unknown function (DUF6206)